MNNKEYRIDIKIRNNIILSKINSKFKMNIPEFSRKFNISYTLICRLLAMTISPFMKSGKFRSSVLKISDILECAPEDLFSESQIYALLKTNKKSIEVSEVEAKFYLENSNDNLSLEDNFFKQEKNKYLLNMIDKRLSPREKEVIYKRFGLEGEEFSLRDIAADFKIVSAERIRQIEAKALRKLRSAYHNSKLKEYIDE